MCSCHLWALLCLGLVTGCLLLAAAMDATRVRRIVYVAPHSIVTDVPQEEEDAYAVATP
jgi:hypothetical protein